MTDQIRLFRPELAACRFFSIAWVLILASFAQADIIPDGYKSVPSETLVEGMDQYPDLIFALYPVSIGGGNGGQEVKSGESVRFYHFASPDLYALKKGTDIKSEAVFEDESLPRSDIAISQVGNVPLAEKAKSIRRVYRITGISGNRIALERQPDQRFDAKGNLMDGAPAIAPTQAEATKKKFMLAGGVGLVAVGTAFFLWVRRKRLGTIPA